MDYSKITTFEAVATMSLVALTPILLTYPQNESIEFGSASVLQFLYSSIITCIFLFVFLYLYKPFKGKNVLDVSEFLGGKILKATTGILIALYSLIVCAFTLYEFGEDLQNVMFLNSSMAQVNILLVIAMGFGAYYGLKGIFRSSTVIFPIVVSRNSVAIFSIIQQNRFNKFNTYIWHRI